MKRHIAARRERNKKLGEQDAANRCAYCKIALKAGARFYLHGAWFCSFGCGDDWFTAKSEAADAV